jgi:hypothetical protein
MRVAKLILMLAASLTGAGAELHAQAIDPAGAAQDGAPANRYDVQLVGGLTTYIDAPHAAVGVMARAHRGPWSLLALGTVGKGAEYDSQMYGGGLARHVLRRGSIDFSALAGYAYYHESYWTGIARSAPSPLLGAVATMHRGRLTLSLTFLDLFGRYDGDDVVEGYGFQVPRLLFGVGF